MTSYGYKHKAESYFNTYISNDAFKEAAKILDIKSKPASGENEYYALKFNCHKYDMAILSKNRAEYTSAINRIKELETLHH
jgi:hypothetical protein